MTKKEEEGNDEWGVMTLIIIMIYTLMDYAHMYILMKYSYDGNNKSHSYAVDFSFGEMKLSVLIY